VTRQDWLLEAAVDDTTKVELSILILLDSISDKSQRVHGVSQKQIADRLGVSERGVFSSLKRLSEKGYLNASQAGPVGRSRFAEYQLLTSFRHKLKRSAGRRRKADDTEGVWQT
jgi:DNA-binding MarR family transcriptional regulator